LKVFGISPHLQIGSLRKKIDAFRKIYGLSVHLKLIDGFFNNSLAFAKTASTEWSMKILFWQGSGGRHLERNKSLLPI